MILELDTFYFSKINKNKTAYCLIESVPVQEMFNIEKNLDLHKNLVKNYKLRNWKYCEDVIEHLNGKWNGELDSFYNDISDRVKNYKIQQPNKEWTGIIQRD
jgi:hypothetical protein